MLPNSVVLVSRAHHVQNTNQRDCTLTHGSNRVKQCRAECTSEDCAYLDHAVEWEVDRALLIPAACKVKFPALSKNRLRIHWGCPSSVDDVH